MSVRLEGPRTVGARRVAVLTEHVVRKAGIGGAALFGGTKRPLAVLIREDGETRLHPLDRRADTPEKVEKLVPGALDAMEDEA